MAVSNRTTKASPKSSSLFHLLPRRSSGSIIRREEEIGSTLAMHTLTHKHCKHTHTHRKKTEKEDKQEEDDDKKAAPRRQQQQRHFQHRTLLRLSLRSTTQKP